MTEREHSEPVFRCDYFITTEDGTIREAVDAYDAINNSRADYYALCMVGTKHDLFPLVWHVEKSVLGVLRRMTCMETESIEEVLSDFYKDNYCFWMILPATKELYDSRRTTNDYIIGHADDRRVDIRKQ